MNGVRFLLLGAETFTNRDFMDSSAATPSIGSKVETRFERDGGGTLMTMRMTLPDEKTRAQMLASGMEHGMEASYVRLEGLIERSGVQASV